MQRPSPQDYVKAIERDQGVLNLYSSRPSFKVSQEEWIGHLKGSLGEVLEGVYGTLEEAETDLRNRDLSSEAVDNFYDPPILRWARGKATELLRQDAPKVKDLFVGTVSIPVFNAAAVRCDEQTDLVLFNLPLLFLLPDASGVLKAAENAWAGLKWQELRRHHIEFGAVTESLVRGNIFDRTRADQGAADFFSFRTGVITTEICTLFILLHEFAHVFLGHLNTAYLGPDLLSDRDTEARIYTHSQKQELEADAAAAQLLLSLSFDALKEPAAGVVPVLEVLRDPELAVFIPLSVLTLFTIFEGLEGRFNVPSDTHPPASARRKQFLTIVERSPLYAQFIELLRELAGFHAWFVQADGLFQEGAGAPGLLADPADGAGG